MRAYAQLTTSFVIFVNRVGIDESISFWGGSEIIAPTGQAVMSAPMFDEGLFVGDIVLDDIRRERIALPLLRDERPDLLARELSRVIAERAGMAPDENAEPGAEEGHDIAPGFVPGRPIGFGLRPLPDAPTPVRPAIAPVPSVPPATAAPAPARKGAQPRSGERG
jgi:hypothetical protein